MQHLSNAEHFDNCRTYSVSIPRSAGTFYRVRYFFHFKLPYRLDFYSFRQEFVTRHFQAIGNFLFEPRYFRAAKAIFRLTHELLGIGAVHGAIVLVKVDCFIPKHCNA